jgi:hypothetical protein
MSARASLVLRLAVCALCLHCAASAAAFRSPAHSPQLLRGTAGQERRAAPAPPSSAQGSDAAKPGNDAAKPTTMQASFEKVYKTHKWTKLGGGSGLGSHLPNTVLTRRIILTVGPLPAGAAAAATHRSPSLVPLPTS